MSEHPNPNLVAVSLGYVQRWLEQRELEKAGEQAAEVVTQSIDAGARSAEGPAA